ncbi:SOS response-associated peptidase [Pseudoduganella sp. UC29_71]|jgi:putative SOS response-associated peptidase YedK|uniref:SOS response-associated peptidase n=1 Tax=Pseudoduganella sp. UC29_71 TaxID=3350174 RepID=UPI00366AC598
MCGRFDQNDTMQRYLSAFGWADAVYRGEAGATPNAAPGTYRPVLHMQDGVPQVDDLYWGYRAAWAAQKLPVCYNARLEKVANNYWGRMLKTGRALVPASGWYEWTGPKGQRQPWHIHRKDREPIFMLALANFGPYKGHKAESGFVLITADSAGGMVDIHDRRPVCLNAADAATWLDPDLSMEQAEMLARSMALGPEEFEWFRVSPDLNRAGNEGDYLIVPLAD